MGRPTPRLSSHNFPKAVITTFTTWDIENSLIWEYNQFPDFDQNTCFDHKVGATTVQQEKIHGQKDLRNTNAGRP